MGCEGLSACQRVRLTLGDQDGSARSTPREYAGPYQRTRPGERGAVESLLAGQHINEALISQIRASDDWGYYQAKGIKAGVLGAKMELLTAEGKTASGADEAKAAQYVKEQADISDKARDLEKEATEHIERHEKLATAVTMCQIGIAISAIAILTKRRFFWLVGILFGGAGVVSMIFAFLHRGG